MTRHSLRTDEDSYNIIWERWFHATFNWQSHRANSVNERVCHWRVSWRFFHSHRYACVDRSKIRRVHYDIEASQIGRLMKLRTKSLASRIRHLMNGNLLTGEWFQLLSEHFYLNIVKRRGGLHLLRHPLLLLSNALLLLRKPLGELVELFGLGSKLSIGLFLFVFMLAEFDLKLEIGLFNFLGFFVCGCDVRECFACIIVGLGDLHSSSDFVCGKINIFEVANEVAIMNRPDSASEADNRGTNSNEFGNQHCAFTYSCCDEASFDEHEHCGKKG